MAQPACRDGDAGAAARTRIGRERRSRRMVVGTMTSVDENGSSAITILLREAEIAAERTTGWVRIALAAALAVSMLVSAEIASVAGIEEFWARLGLGALAIGALLA